MGGLAMLSFIMSAVFGFIYMITLVSSDSYGEETVKIHRGYMVSSVKLLVASVIVNCILVEVKEIRYMEENCLRSENHVDEENE